MIEILFSREAEEFFEDLLISGFSDIEMRKLKQIRDAKSIVDGEIQELLSAIEKDEEINYTDKAHMVDQLKKVLHSKDYTLLRSAPFKTDILDKYFISSIPIYSYIQLITAMQLGFAIGINRGISSGLPRKRTWHIMLKDVWKKCARDVHPFQKGDTNQVIKHCMTIVKYLNRMKYRINVSLSDAVILLISAAVHKKQRGRVFTLDRLAGRTTCGTLVYKLTWQLN